MLKRLSIFAFLFATLIGFSSCGGDDDDDTLSGSSGGTSSFTINGKKTGKILYTLCEKGLYNSVILEAHFSYDDDMMSFNLSVPFNSISALQKDLDITDDINITRFYPKNGAFIGHKSYEYIDGSAVVKSVSSKEVVVKYSNFRFLRELGDEEDTFTINGTISYTINEVD